MFQKLQKYNLITHTIFAMVNLCKVQEICQSSAIFIKKSLQQKCVPIHQMISLDFE
jgi:hypothetical protein